TLSTIEKYLTLDSGSEWAERLRSIQDKLRLSSYGIFNEEIEEAFKNKRFHRLKQAASYSPHAIWLIKKSLRNSLKLEIEGQTEAARQAFDMAQALEEVYRQFAPDSDYRPLIHFYTRLTPAQKQQKYEADHLANEALSSYQNGDLKKS